MESIPLEFTETLPDGQNNKYGEKMKYDASGPYQKTRTRTDTCWLIGFVLFSLTWSIVVIYAFCTGDTNKWLKPKDSVGRVCGYDSGVENKPYLVRYDPEICELPDCLVCRSECPKSDFKFEDPIQLNKHVNESNKLDVEKSNGNSKGTPKSRKNETESVNKASEIVQDGNEHDKGDNNAKPNESPKTASITSTASPQNNASNPSSKKSKLDETIKNIICQSDVKVDLIDNWDALRYLVDRRKCSRTYKKTDAVYEYRCGFNLTNYEDEFDNDDSWRSNVPIVTRDLSNAKFSIMGFIALSGTMALLIIFLMRWYALAYVCSLIFVICAFAFHLIYEKCVLEAESKTNGVLLALFFGVVVVVLILLTAIYFRQQLCLACQMIRESSKAITCVLSSLLVPFASFVIYTMIFILGVSTYYLLSTLESPVYRADFDDEEKCECPSSTKYSQNSICEPLTFDSQCRKTTDGGNCVLSGCYAVEQVQRNVGVLQFINSVGLIWSFWFVTGFNDTVLASVYSIWYWTFNKKILSYMSVIESFWRMSTYHLGTVVVGSLLLLVCTIVRAIVKGIERSLKKSKKPCAAVVLVSLQCAFDLMERSVDFINRRAYVMCAMHGTSFFVSAKMAYYLLKRNIGKVIAVVTITNWLTFVTTVLIACITTRVSMSYYDTYREDDLVYPGMPPMFVFLGSYGICCLLMRVVEVAVDTVFTCFLEDTERNDGTSEKPYFMSEQLTKLLYNK